MILATNQDISDIVFSPQRKRLITTMAEYFDALGYIGIRARIGGFSPPEILSGQVEDHRPDITGRWRRRRGMICDIVTAEEMKNWNPNRYSLFASAAELHGYELHYACPSTIEQATGESMVERLTRRLLRHGVRPNKIWSL